MWFELLHLWLLLGLKTLFIMGGAFALLMLGVFGLMFYRAHERLDKRKREGASLPSNLRQLARGEATKNFRASLRLLSKLRHSLFSTIYALLFGCVTVVILIIYSLALAAIGPKLTEGGMKFLLITTIISISATINFAYRAVKHFRKFKTLRRAFRDAQPEKDSSPQK